MRLARSKPIRYGLLALLLIVAGIIAFWPLTREPTYEGRPFNYWLDQLPSTFLVGGGHSRTSPFAYKTVAEAQAGQTRVKDVTQRALRAVSTIGPEHLDVLVARLQRQDSRAKITLQRWAVRVGLRVGLMSRMPLLSTEVRRGQALTALVELGDAARPIVPELLLLTESRDTNMRLAALHAIQKINFPFGKDEWPIVE
jgi:hypothetical protein